MGDFYSYIRPENEKEIEAIIKDQLTTQFVYVRGRRRVGKSWLLKKIAEQNPKLTIYFSGAKDESGDEVRKSFVNAISKAIGPSILQEINKDLLDWRRIFSELSALLRAAKRKLTLIFDEIQWIAKSGSGFIGALKTAWIDFERYNLCNIIICGSSNRFFDNNTGGEEKLLRGLQTRGAIRIEPIPLYDVKKFYFPKWTNQQVAALYQLIGGIPYYLKQIDPKLGFINAINTALFSPSTIFLDEVNDILGLDFNQLGITNVKRILKSLAVHGGSQAKVRERFKLSTSTLSDLFQKLERYGLIRISVNYSAREQLQLQGKENRYFINDFYLNSFFALLDDLKREIQRAHPTNNIFANRIINDDGYYIENFSGKAFEHLTRHCIETYDLNTQLMNKLTIKDHNFEIYSESNSFSEVDLIVEGKRDRIVRVIECKSGATPELSWIDEVVSKSIKLNSEVTRLNCLVIATCKRVAKEFKKKAADRDVRIVELADFFE